MDLDCNGLLDSLKRLNVTSAAMRCNRDPSYPSTTPNATSPASSQTPGPTPTSSSGPSSGGSSPANTGLSTHGKIGMGVGVGVGVPLVVGSIVLATLLLRRRAHKTGNVSPASEKSEVTGEGLRPETLPYDNAGYGAVPATRIQHIENLPITGLSGTQVRRSGSKFREHGLRPDGRDDLPP